MREELIEATSSALSAVIAPRYYETERGFHGRFYSALQNELTRMGFADGRNLLEMEYQKTVEIHGTGQRPDIVLHVPRPADGDAAVDNVAVWALKRRASESAALHDFQKLDVMFRTLNYPLGFFVNVDDQRSHRSAYTGEFPERLVAIAVHLENGRAHITVDERFRADLP